MRPDSHHASLAQPAIQRGKVQLPQRKHRNPGRCGKRKTAAIHIKDTGPGISQEEKNKIFEPFNRLHTPGLQEEGTGIGLTITKPDRTDERFHFRREQNECRQLLYRHPSACG